MSREQNPWSAKPEWNGKVEQPGGINIDLGMEQMKCVEEVVRPLKL